MHKSEQRTVASHLAHQKILRESDLTLEGHVPDACQHLDDLSHPVRPVVEEQSNISILDSASRIDDDRLNELISASSGVAVLHCLPELPFSFQSLTDATHNPLVGLLDPFPPPVAIHGLAPRTEELKSKKKQWAGGVSVVSARDEMLTIESTSQCGDRSISFLFLCTDAKKSDWIME